MNYVSRNLWLIVVAVTGFILSEPANKACIPAGHPCSDNTCCYIYTPKDSIADSIVKICENLESALGNYNTLLVRELSDSLFHYINIYQINNKVLLARSYYLIGASKVILQKESDSFSFFKNALHLLENSTDDNLKSRILYLMGYSFNKIGDHLQSVTCFDESLKLKKKIFGEDSPELLPVYISLSIAKINTRDYKNAISIINDGLSVATGKGSKTSPSDLALLYQNKGIALSMISEHKQAINNLLKALSIYDINNLPADINRLNLINNIATSYFYLGNNEKTIHYFEIGYKQASGMNSLTSFYFVLNYARVLGKLNKKERGREILNEIIGKLRQYYSDNSREYTEMLSNYAGYLRNNGIGRIEPLKIYEYCYNYLKFHPWDHNLYNQIAVGYALSLMDNGKPDAALDSIKAVLFRNAEQPLPENPLSNPDINFLRKDKTTWEILRARYLILQNLYKLNGSFDILLNSAATAEMMVKILESIRLNLGEEESRLLLGERYRDSYMFAIESFNKCYDITNELSYLEKVFEYSEKSKAASLLSYTREAKGLKYHIPPQLAEMEQELNLKVGFYESKLSGEQNSDCPDKRLIEEWTENLIFAQGKRDSLIETFEKNYPGYYKLKYDTKVVSSKDVPSIIGKKVNYVSYIVNDTSLHILLVNSKYTVIKTVAIDSSFLERINSFRQLLSDPVKERNTRDAFLKFQSDGYKFYSLLLEPVTDYFISNRLIISPDDELSFFPFEVLLYAETRDSSLFYNNLNYLMKKYDISYAYSATLLSETRRVRPSFFNNALVIAPSYGSPVSIEASSKERNIFLELPDLHYAREEAVYVSKIIPGKIFTDNQATEEAYKNEAGNYDIVHLAMHTVVDGVSPVNSGMVFYQKETASEDVFLRLYEIYRVPLNSKMVVLSSCYTGSGTLYAGEGVLSLARGFILSGSSSVVMSLWEVNDKAAAEIIKSFYKNIKAGLRKSQALKKARIKFLEKSDMLQSHPYYWSTLVIYGDDSQLYIRWQIKVIVLFILAMVLIALIYYFRKR